MALRSLRRLIGLPEPLAETCDRDTRERALVEAVDRNSEAAMRVLQSLRGEQPEDRMREVVRMFREEGL